jgi:hypothetical protein
MSSSSSNETPSDAERSNMGYSAQTFQAKGPGGLRRIRRGGDLGVGATTGAYKLARAQSALHSHIDACFVLMFLVNPKSDTV